MNPNDNNGEWNGDLENVAKNIPSIEVDCSGWDADIPEDQWSHGELENLAKPVPAVVIDCSGWDTEPVAWLELVVDFDVNTPPAKVVVHTHRLIHAVASAVPELGLQYDLDRSRTEGESIIVALKKIGRAHV